MKNVFLSYSRKDLGFVEKFANDLQRAGYDVWYDLTDLIGGDRWADEIEAAIDKCDAFITVISPNSMSSNWVEKEFLYANSLRKNIVPVQYKLSRLPIWLLDVHFIDLRGRNYKKKFPLILAAIEEMEQPASTPGPDRGWFGLNPSWMGGIAGGIVLVLIAAFGLRALLNGADRVPDGMITTIPIDSFSTVTPVPATEIFTPEVVAPETVVPDTPPPSEIITPEPPTEVPVTPTLALERTDSKGAEMVLVPAGNFYMGNKSDASGELPINVINLNDFYIDRYEVTIQQYKQCVEAQGCKLPTNQRAYFDTRLRNHPVTYVDWDMAGAFCAWRGARLPTDAEWEKASRGNEEPYNYPWGDAFDGTIVNFCDEKCSIVAAKNTNYFDGYENTAPVGSYEGGVSPYGLYDMAGNIAEWVNDWYDAGYYLAPPTQEPSGPETGTLHVLRGGSWVDNLYSVRVFVRQTAKPDETVSYIGFRCAADATQ